MTQLSPKVSPYDALVFAGGGCRCFWQLGFVQALEERAKLRPRQITATSAGAAMASAFFAGRSEAVVDYFCERVGANSRNFYPANVLRSTPAFPHEKIYRDTILHCLDDDAVHRLRDAPQIRVLLSRLPGWLGPRLGVVAGFLAYEGEKLMAPRMHPRLPTRLGFRPQVVALQTCSTAQEVADLVLHSSCTPPMTPVYHRDGAPVLDGGLIDNVPVRALAPGAENVLVLLSRPYRTELVPEAVGMTYVQPSKPIEVEKWDYTSPDRIRRTLELGRRDGAAFLAQRSSVG